MIVNRVKIRTMRGAPVIDALQHYRNTKTKQTRTVVWFDHGASTDLADTELVEVLPDSALRVANGALVCARDGAAFDTIAALKAHADTRPARPGHGERAVPDGADARR